MTTFTAQHVRRRFSFLRHQTEPFPSRPAVASCRVQEYEIMIALTPTIPTICIYSTCHQLQNLDVP